MAYSCEFLERSRARVVSCGHFNQCAIIVILCVLMCPMLAQGQTSQPPSPQKIARSTVAIVVADCRVDVAKDVKLAFQRSGALSFLTPQGSWVKQGDVIASLDDSIAKAAYLIAARESSNDIEIRFAKKAGELAQLKYERAMQADKTLSGTVTEFELRELRLAAERSLLQLQQAEHQFAIAELKKNEQLELLKSLQITSPFDGFVRVSQKQPGEFVRDGEVVLEIVNDSVIRVHGSLDLSDLPRVAIGNPVTISSKQLGESTIFHGSINFVDTKVEPVSLKVKFSALIRNVDSILKDGLLVTMAIAPSNSDQLSSR